MKFIAEFNPTELRDVIISGTLLSLVECIKTAEDETKTAIQSINDKTAPIPAMGPVQTVQQLQQQQQQQQPQVQQAYSQPIPQQPAAQSTYAQPTQQYATPAQIPQQAYPGPQQAAPQGVVPTAAQTYTLEQLSVAGTQLIDAGRMAELQQLLTGFGVTSLMQLSKEQYGAFATQLRAMGAKI